MAALATQVHAEDVRFGPRGSEWTLALGSERHAVQLPLLGDFNIMNALAAAGVPLTGPSGAVVVRDLATDALKDLDWVPDEKARQRVLVENPAKLYQF